MTSSMTGYSGPIGTNTGKQFREKIPKGYSASALQQFTPEQMNLFQQMLGQVGPDSYLSRLAGGDQSLFGEIEAPALKQFSGLQGNIASRFSGMGVGGRKSSGFQNTMNSAAQNFAGQLQSNRQALQRQAIQDLHRMSQDLLNQRPFERTLTKKEENPWAEIIGKLAGAVPGLAASYFGGGSPGSALKGALSIFGGGGSGGNGYNFQDQMNSGAGYFY